MAKKRKSPSREKYENENPVVSFRVSKKDYARFEAIRQKLGLSHGDVYRNGLGVNEVKVSSEEKIREEAYDEGWERGINSTWDFLAVTYPCSKCGKTITVETKEEKAAIRTYMREHGWGHAKCPEKER